MVQIKFVQKLWSLYFNILTFWYQVRDHFKNVDCSSYSVIFAKFDLSTKKPKKATSWNRWFKSNLDKTYETTHSKY